LRFLDFSRFFGHLEYNMKGFLLAVVLLSIYSLALGQYPYKNCGGPSDHFSNIKVSVSPNPPVIGQNLTVVASGNTDEVVNGGTVLIDLTFDGIELLNTTFNLCTLIQTLAVPCPLQKGFHQFTVVQPLPSEVPAGDYIATVNAWDQNGQELMCISATITINSKKRSEE